MALEKINQCLSLEINGAPGMEQVLYMSQGDHGLREVTIELRQSGSHYPIMETDCDAVLFCDKPDGKAIFNPAVIQNQKIEVTFTDQMLTAAGPMPCRVALIGKKGERLTSADFIVMIRENRSDAAALSSDEFNTLTKALSRIDEVLEKIDQASEAVAGYEIRVQSALEENKEAVKAAQAASAETNAVKEATQTVKEATQDVREKTVTAAKNADAATVDARAAQKQAEDAAKQANTAAGRADQATKAVTEKQATMEQSVEKAEGVIEHYQSVARAITTAVTVSTEKAKAAEESQKAAANSEINAVNKAGEARTSAERAETAAHTAETEAAKVKTWKPVIQNGILTFALDNTPVPPEGCKITGRPGADGKAGTQWFFGTEAPASIPGEKADFYLNTANGDLYSKATGNWEKIGNLKGGLASSGGEIEGSVSIAGDMHIANASCDVMFSENGVALRHGQSMITIDQQGITLFGEIYLNAGSRKAMKPNPADDEIATVGWIRQHYPQASEGPAE